MKMKYLTLSFLACAGLAGCTSSTTAESPYSVICKDNQENITFQAHSDGGLSGSSGGSTYTYIEAIDGRRHEQTNGLCTSDRLPEGTYAVMCKDRQGKITFQGQSDKGLLRDYISIHTVDRRLHEQMGGVCTSLRRPDRLYAVTCRDDQGQELFTGLTDEGLQGSNYIRFQTTDDRIFEQAGGICISSKRAALKPN